MILAGDLNFTSPLEIWGQKALHDPLSGYFKSLFHKHYLIDVNLAETVPTWKNSRVRVDSISKRLDMFFIAEEILATTQRYRSWVKYPFISDHAPICLELGQGFPKVYYPFKFNLGWIREDSFATLVKDVW
jgi:endonuclease/exonuclease/phosphatase family metal-dependent hydrolase